MNSAAVVREPACVAEPFESLRQLLAHWPPLREAEEITRMPMFDRSHRATYRLTFVDGQVIKGRMRRRALQTAFLQGSLERLPRREFAQLLDFNDEATLEEWVDGTPADRLPRTPELMRDCGRFLGRMHRTECPQRNPRLQAANYANWLDAMLLRLLLAQLIDVPMARRIVDFMEAQRPRAAEFGLNHRDFGPDNLVLRDGTLCSIDHQSLCERALHDDLGRAWYRWGMPGPEWAPFLAGYNEVCPVQTFAERPAFWLAFTLLATVETRLRYDVSGGPPAVEILQRWMDDPSSIPAWRVDAAA